jgi:hypothetical protein
MSSKPTGLDWDALRAANRAAVATEPPAPPKPPVARGPRQPGVRVFGGRERKLSPAQEQAARQRYEDGLHLIQVAAEFGVGKTSARRAVLRAGGVLRPRAWANKYNRRVLTDQQEIEMARRYAAGEVSTALNKEYGVGLRTFWRIIAKHNNQPGDQNHV